MKFSELLKKQLEARKKKINELAERSKASQNIDEVRSIGAEIDSLRAEVADLEAAIVQAEAEEEQERQRQERENEERSRNPFPVNNPQNGNTNNLAYRQAFMQYVQHGTPIPEELRAAGPSVKSEVSALIPEEIMREVIHAKPTQNWGNLYNKVRKLAIAYGVKFPISDLTATFVWLSNEKASIEPTNAGNANTYVTFSENIGSVSFSQSLLVSIETLDVFEKEMGRLLNLAFLEAMDTAIIKGNGTTQPLGITQDPRVTNKVTFGEGAKDIDKWDKWNSLLWKAVPEGKEDGTLIIGHSTYYTHLINVQDANKKPLTHETINQMNEKGVIRNFMGREVLVVPDKLLPDFDTAGDGGNEVFAIWANLSDYAINNLKSFGILNWYDHKTHATATEGLVVCDGKVLDANGFIKIVKGA